MRRAVLLALATGAVGCASAHRADPAAAVSPRFDAPETIHIVDAATGEGAPRVTTPDRGPRFPGTSIFAGTVVVAFVIDAAGAPELATTAILESTAPEFTRSVCEFLAETSYIPGTVDGVPRRTLVVAPFLFSFQGAQPREPDMNRYRAFLMNTPRDELLGMLGSHRSCPGLR